MADTGDRSRRKKKRKDKSRAPPPPYEDDGGGVGGGGGDYGPAPDDGERRKKKKKKSKGSRSRDGDRGTSDAESGRSSRRRGGEDRYDATDGGNGGDDRGGSRRGTDKKKDRRRDRDRGFDALAAEDDSRRERKKSKSKSKAAKSSRRDRRSGREADDDEEGVHRPRARLTDREVANVMGDADDLLARSFGDADSSGGGSWADLLDAHTVGFRDTTHDQELAQLDTEMRALQRVLNTQSVRPGYDLEGVGRGEEGYRAVDAPRLDGSFRSGLGSFRGGGGGGGGYGSGYGTLGSATGMGRIEDEDDADLPAGLNDLDVINKQIDELNDMFEVRPEERVRRFHTVELSHLMAHLYKHIRRMQVRLDREADNIRGWMEDGQDGDPSKEQILALKRLFRQGLHTVEEIEIGEWDEDL